MNGYCYFILGILILAAGYFTYGRVLEKIFRPDASRQTPAVACTDGGDYVVMPRWRVFLIQLLNIAGLGPIFGAVMGVLYGPAALLWIVIGCIFGGMVHDYFSGMISLRHKGENLPEILGRYLGSQAQWISRAVCIVFSVLVGVVFAVGPAAILAPMAQIRDGIQASRGELARFRHAPRFAPAGQSTQMIVGATPESDRHILMLTQGLYDKYHLKRVFYSAYIPVSSSSLLPAPQGFQPPLLREHRLYQADWLLRFYHFRAEELLDEGRPDFDLRLDPKCGWALRHLDQFPVEVQRADYEALLRVPGIGVTSAKRILTARRAGPLSFSGLKKLGVVLKRAQYFITCSGRMLEGLRVREEGILSHLAALDRPALAQVQPEQLSLFGEEGAS